MEHVRPFTPAFNFTRDPSKIIQTLKKINCNDRDYISYEIGDAKYLYFPQNLFNKNHCSFVNENTWETIELDKGKLFSHYHFLTGKPIDGTIATIPQQLLEQVGISTDIFDELESELEVDDLDQYYHDTDESFSDPSLYLDDTIKIKLKIAPELKEYKELLRNQNDMPSSQDQMHPKVPQDSNSSQISFSSNNSQPFQNDNIPESRKTLPVPIIEKIYKKAPDYVREVHEFLVTNRLQQNLSDYIHRRKTNDDILNELHQRIIKLTCEKYQLQNEVADQKRKISLDHAVTTCYKDKLRQLLNDKIILEATIKKQANEIEELHMKIKSFQQETIVTKEKVIAYFEQNVPSTISKLGWNLMKEQFINAHETPLHRRFSDESKEIYFVLNALGANVYDLSRGLFPIPSYITVHNKLYSEVLKTERNILDMKRIPDILNQYVTDYKINTTVFATLAIDALCVTPITVSNLKTKLKQSAFQMYQAFMTQIVFKKQFIRKQKDKVQAEYEKCTDEKKKEKLKKLVSEYNMKLSEKNINSTELNNIFIFYLQPHDPSISPIPLHIFLHEHGSASLIVREVTTQVLSIAQCNKNIDIIDVSTDGDNGHQQLYKKAKLLLLLLSPTLDINEITQKLHNHDTGSLASADMLHFVKTLRVKFLLQKVSIFVTNMNNTFDFKLLKNLLGKGPEVVDCSHIGKMRDVYPLKLFTLRNINTLIEKFTDCDNFEEKKNVATCIICFLPCVLWLNATTNKIFSPNCRVFLLKLTFEFIKRLYNIMSTKNEWDPRIKQFSKDESYVTMCTKAGLERLIPTLVVLISELEKFIQSKQEDSTIDFAFDRIGTHPLENFNALIRNCSRGNDTINSSSHIIARAMVVKRLLHKYGLKKNHKGRINSGGLKLSECVDDNEALDAPEIKTGDLADALFILFDAASPETILNPNETINREYVNDITNAFFAFLLNADDASSSLKTELNLSVPHPTRNSKIDSRNFGFQVKNESND